MTPPARFASVDALRGITVAAMLLVNNPGDWGHVYAPLLHSEWNGCTPTDLVFPFFLFIVGVSIALGIVPRVEAGADIAALRRAVLLRAAKIIGLGLLLHLLAFWLLDKPWFRPWGVLQRIGLCFAAAGLLATATRAKAQWTIVAALLLGYWALLVVGGSFAPWDNLASRIDTALLGPMAYQFDAASGRGHDPEGLLSTLPAIATTLLGMRAGQWLRGGDLKRLLLAGVIAMAVGFAWSHWFPLNKNLWTSSYVLWTAGWAMLALALCHVLIDDWKWPALGRRFGANAIAAYVGSAAMVYALAGLGWWEPIYRIGFSDWMAPRAGPYLPSLVFALAFVGLWWAVVYWMDRRRWYLKL
ncbi:MAG: acyltransferase family protein [Pseudoxanthomonas sp.]